MNYYPIVISNDGDTWCDFESCEAIYVTESGYEKLHEGAKIRELIPGEDYTRAELGMEGAD